MQEHSPNWYWQQIGAQIDRNGLHRKITLLGHVVCERAGYEIELAISRWIYEGTK